MTTEFNRSPGLRARMFHRWVAPLLGMDLERRHEIYLDLAASATLRDGADWLPRPQ